MNFVQLASIFAISASPFVGSFLGTLVVRLPEGRAFAVGRSICDHCSNRLAPMDMVPIASWLRLKGRCRQCGGAFGLEPLFAEIGAVLVAVMSVMLMSGWVLLVGCVFGWTLLVLAMIDWQHYWLPDGLTFPLIPGGLAVAYAISLSRFELHCAAIVVGMAAMGTIAIAYRWWRKREGLGLGDVKLIGALGAWLGPDGLPTAFLYGVAFALIFVLAKSLSGKKVAGDDKLPLGTFLAAGGWLVWLMGPLVAAS